MAQPQDGARYLRWLAGTVLCACTLVALLVLLVDPYGLYGHWFQRAGFNVVKPGLMRYPDEIKLARAPAYAPRVLILGNSRAEIGFDPDGPALAGAMAYNLAISGSGIEVAHNQLVYLLGTGQRPTLIVQGLDFLDFIDAPGRTTRYAAPPVVHPVQRTFWRFDSLFSLTSLQDALHTVAIQRAPDAQTSTGRGFNPLFEYRAMARGEGYYALFQQRAQENARVYLKKAAGRRSAADFQHLEAMLELAARTGIEVRLLVYPYHGQILALYEAAGLWPAFARWKRDLVASVDRVRQRYPRAQIQLFDFSGYGPAACERIPARGDLASVTRWYWEAGHFKAALGERVLARMLQPQTGTGEFGFVLEADTLAENARRIARERIDCQHAYPALFTDSAALVAGAGAR